MQEQPRNTSTSIVTTTNHKILAFGPNPNSFNHPIHKYYKDKKKRSKEIILYCITNNKYPTATENPTKINIPIHI